MGAAPSLSSRPRATRRRALSRDLQVRWTWNQELAGGRWRKRKAVPTTYYEVRDDTRACPTHISISYSLETNRVALTVPVTAYSEGFRHLAHSAPLPMSAGGQKWAVLQGGFVAATTADPTPALAGAPFAAKLWPFLG